MSAKAALILSGIVVASGALASPALAAPRSATIGRSMASAGYMAPVTKASTASLKLTVPTITCAGDTAPIYLGVLLNGPMKVGGNRAGTGVFVELTCEGTTPTYRAELQHDSQPGPQFAVHAGDALAVDLAVGGAAEHVTVSDTTSGKQESDDSGTGIHPDNLQVTAQGGTGSGGFAPFSPIVYRSIVLNGAPFSAANPTGFKQVDAANDVMIKTSALQGTQGDKFTLKYVSNS